MQFSQHVLTFLRSLQFTIPLSPGVEVMNPFGDKDTMDTCTKFYNKYYSDNRERRIIIGINPGRFGGGITGIPFTDPIRLAGDCGIAKPFQLRQELSSVFMY